MFFRGAISAAAASVLHILSTMLVTGCGKNAVAEFPEVTVKISVPAEVSTGMLRAFIYDSGSGELRGQTFISNKESNSDGTALFSITEKLRRGTYDIIAYNFDMPDTFIRGEDNIATLEAFTHEIDESIKARYGTDVTSGESISYTPDRMVVARIMGANITDGAVISGQAVSTVKFTNLTLGAEGLSWSTTRSAVAKGFATSWLLGTGKAGSTGSLYFELVSDGSKGLSASVPSFGEASESYDFVINVTTSEGSYNYSTTTDRSFKFIDSIIIPEPEHKGGDSGSGFSPQVGEWNHISVDIPV